jgi:hypothetical protein
VQSEHQALSTTNLSIREIDFGPFEYFVDEQVIARFLDMTPRRVLEMARSGEIPAHPIGSGVRKTWRFRVSEIDAHFSKSTPDSRASIAPAAPRAGKRRTN